MENNLLIIPPKCPEHKKNLSGRLIFIDTSDKKKYAGNLWYCGECDAYGDYFSMEKDVKKVALDFIRLFNKNYQESDIANIDIKY